ncbi:putative chitin synthase activator (Chs3) [Aspergillus clavatus NRRL 1]|uniref:Chitin synthase activator (Chs3), putative n=1 Tax=Aspergillus clavatus (strain ATCC 1007 / CBS 513.65 / DSM 816 / NCTC 3887 / NRRL 1 / QM 1276 / 107) TaxID=344612 RepID=A1CMM1_ASPCL|nr:chitin synthase activator (Chs3), putative [Aspergillus clavatus NRRL 1]EAW08808.1 chitin synthase activator (Chs3), putative [Aspergillus clavatus NRRL 1]
MAYPPPQSQRPPPVRNYGPRPAARGPPAQGQMPDGSYDQRSNNDYGYGAYGDGGYDNAGYGYPDERAVPRSHGPSRGQPRPPRGGYGSPMEQPRDRGYAHNGRPPPGSDSRRGYGDRRQPPPREDRMRPSGRPPMSDQNRMAWDNPFPAFPPQGRGGPGLQSIEHGMTAMDLNGQMPPERGPPRPHTSNGRREVPRPPPSTSPGRGRGGYPDGPVRSASAGRSARRPSDAYERSYTDPNDPPPMPYINRSATMPVSSASSMPPAAKPSYPGQPTYQDPNTANDYSDTDELLSYYNSVHADEPDMPNFDAIPDGAKAIDENLPGLEQPKPKPNPPMDPASSSSGQYAAFNSNPAHAIYHTQSQPNMGAATAANQFENAGFHFDLPGNAPPASVHGRGSMDRTYSGPADPYGESMQNQYPQRQGSRGPNGSGYSNGPPRPYRANQPEYANEQPQPIDEMEAHDPQQNPDALPHHPAPFRPGLDQGAKPPPVRQYDNNPIPPTSSTPQAQPIVQQETGPAPITLDELERLQQLVRNKTADQKTQLLFAQKLVEASTVLVDKSRMDAKMKARTRERYIMDALKLVKKLVSAGFADAQFYLADCYGQGLLGLQVDPKEAFTLYHSAAKQGHAQSAYRVAVCCEIGQEEGGGTKRDPFKAVQWYKRAASLGDTPAMYKMGMILVKGLLGQAKNPREGISWLKRAAERADPENPHALHELALMYANATENDVVIRDEAYASQLFHQAAELGYKFSQFRLGAAYEYGLMGCPVDPQQSIFWYTHAAAQGEHQSELSLSGWYLTGLEGILQQSDTEAYLWARKAATAGLAKAEYAMGYFTEVGIGVAANLDDAKRWYWRAAAQGFPKARERLEDIKKGGASMQKTRLSRSAVNRQNQNDGDCVVM